MPSRFAHLRSLSYCPPTPIFEICQELWIEGDQGATVPAFLSVRGSVRSTPCPFVHTTPARTSGRRSCASSRCPHAPRLEVTLPCQPALRRLLCSVSSDYRHHRRAVPLPASWRDGFASTGKVRYLFSPAFPHVRLYLQAGAISVLGGLFAHGAAEEFGQRGIEGGAGLLLDLLQGVVDGERSSLRFFGGQIVKHLGDADNSSEQRCAFFS